MKQIVKRSLVTAALRLPWGARQAMYYTLAQERRPHDELLRMAAALRQSAEIKEIAKRLLGTAALWLPSTARDAIYEALARERRPHAELLRVAAELRRLAKSIGITGFITEGENGTIQGDSDDLLVLPGYASHKRYAYGTNRIFSDF